MAIGSDRIILKITFDGTGTKPKDIFGQVSGAADKFADAAITKPAADACDTVREILADTTASVISRVARIAAVYRRAGMTSSEAFRRAWAEVKAFAEKSGEAIGTYLSGLDEIKKYPAAGSSGGGYTLPGASGGDIDIDGAGAETALLGVEGRLRAIAEALSGLRAALSAAAIVWAASFASFGRELLVLCETLAAVRGEATSTGGSFSFVGAVAEALSALWHGVLVPLAEFLGGAFMTAATAASGIFLRLRDGALALAGILSGALSTAWVVVCDGVTGARGALSMLLDFASTVFRRGWGDVWRSVSDTFTRVWGGIAEGARSPLNLVIGFVNALTSGVASAVNAIAGAINSLSFEVPSWVPGLGGSRLGFDFPTVTAPRIPYLASGAVIPPRAPFLAVLGDQRSGTNVEAPLSTIEDAVEGAVRRAVGASFGGEGGASYRFTAQINRRTLFDEVIAEARLRQTATGKNQLVTL